MTTTKHVISVSGGKDSTATLLMALSRRKRDDIIPIFCDTGNEHEQTYSYLDYLEKTLGIKIHRLTSDFSEQISRKRMFIARDQRTGRSKSGKKIRWSNKAKRRALAILRPTGNPFLDLCLWKGRFPSRKAQFCTLELKRDLAVNFQLDLLDKGFRVVSWQGVRRDESLARKNVKVLERIAPRMWTFRPIAKWTAKQVFDYCAAAGVNPNPLYLQGMTRVGCMPCINVNKGELREIAARFPEHLERISKWELLVSQACKHGYSTFMADSHHGKCPKDVFAELNIWARAEWSKTTRGGHQFDLLANLAEPKACASAYGLCE